MRDSELKSQELPQHEEGGHEVNPNQQEILVVYLEGRVDAVSHSHLVIVSSDSILDEGVDVNKADVDLGLVLIDIIDFFFVIDGLALIDRDKVLLPLLGECLLSILDIGFTLLAEDCDLDPLLFLLAERKAIVVAVLITLS